MTPAANPDLAQALTVSPIAALTPPGSNTAATEPVWFHCSMSIASFFRKDGKKLPFMNHFFKAEIQEDIEYLEEEINKHKNVYLRRATQDEVDHARLMEDPLGTVREAVKEEVISNFTVEDLEKLLEERRKAAANPDAVKAQADAAKIAGTELNKQASMILKAQGVQHAGNTDRASHLGGTSTANIKDLVAGIGKK